MNWKSIWNPPAHASVPVLMNGYGIFILDARQKEHKSVPQILMENQIPIDMVSEVGEECHRFNPFEGRRFHVRCHQYCPEVFAIPEAEENIYYHGYWLNTAWFAAYWDIFLKEFRFPEITDERNLHYLNEITSSPSVSIHIRRGDYITLNMALLMKFYSLCARNLFCAIRRRLESLRLLR